MALKRWFSTFFVPRPIIVTDFNPSTQSKTKANVMQLYIQHIKYLLATTPKMVQNPSGGRAPGWKPLLRNSLKNMQRVIQCTNKYFSWNGQKSSEWRRKQMPSEQTSRLHQWTSASQGQLSWLLRHRSQKRLL